MNQEKLDAIFNEVTEELNLEITKEKMLEHIECFSDGNGKISSQNLSTFCYLESIKYSTHYLHKVLSKVLVDEK